MVHLPTTVVNFPPPHQRRPVNADNGNFAKLKYSSEPFQEIERYTKTQPLSKRNLGFGTKDAFKRGEFTATIRTEQYRCDEGYLGGKTKNSGGGGRP